MRRPALADLGMDMGTTIGPRALIHSRFQLGEKGVGGALAGVVGWLFHAVRPPVPGSEDEPRAAGEVMSLGAGPVEGCHAVAAMFGDRTCPPRKSAAAAMSLSVHAPGRAVLAR